MHYGDILTRAWRITWRHRVLWLFGLVSVLQIPVGLFTSAVPMNYSGWMDLAMRSFEPSRMIITYLAFSLPLALIQTALHSAGTAALIDQTDTLEREVQPTAAGGWAAVRQYFLRLFGIEALLSIPPAALSYLAIVPFAASMVPAMEFTAPGSPPSQRMLSSLFLGLGAGCCIVVPVSTFLALIRILAPLECVLEGRSFWQSIAGAWTVLRRNPKQVIAMALILLGVGLVAGIVLSVPLCLVVVLSLPSAMATAQGGQMPSFTTNRWFVGASWLVSLAVNTPLSVFNFATWTLWYRQLHADPLVADADASGGLGSPAPA